MKMSCTQTQSFCGGQIWPLEDDGLLRIHSLDPQIMSLFYLGTEAAGWLAPGGASNSGLTSLVQQRDLEGEQSEWCPETVSVSEW